MKKFVLLLSLFVMITLSNFAFAATRYPLLEEFTSPTETNALPADNAFDTCIATWGDQIAAIAYHMDTPAPGSPWYIPVDTVRKNFYGQLTIPTGYVDGTYSDYQQWSSMIQQEISNPAPISIQKIGEVFPGMTTQLYAHVHCESAMTGSSHHIYIAVTEDGLVYSPTLRQYKRVVRYISGDGNGEDFTIAPGEDKTYHVEVTIPSQWIWQNLWVESWVQDWDGGHHVENAREIAYTSFGWIPDVEPSSLGNIKAIYR